MSEVYGKVIKMRTREEITRLVKTLIVERLNLKIEVEEVEDSVVFGSTYGFDSTSLLEFIIDLEEKFEIMIPDEELIPDNFNSISNIVTFVLKLLE